MVLKILVFVLIFVFIFIFIKFLIIVFLSKKIIKETK